MCSSSVELLKSWQQFLLAPSQASCCLRWWCLRRGWWRSPPTSPPSSSSRPSHCSVPDLEDLPECEPESLKLFRLNFSPKVCTMCTICTMCTMHMRALVVAPSTSGEDEIASQEIVSEHHHCYHSHHYHYPQNCQLHNHHHGHLGTSWFCIKICILYWNLYLFIKICICISFYLCTLSTTRAVTR